MDLIHAIGLMPPGMACDVHMTDEPLIAPQIGDEIALGNLLMIHIKQHLHMRAVQPAHDGKGLVRAGEEVAGMIIPRVERLNHQRGIGFFQHGHAGAQ